MNTDEIKGGVRNAAGRVQDAVGGLLGDTGAQVEGKFNQAAGSAQGAFGRARETTDDLLSELAGYTKEQPLLALGLTLGVGLVLGLLILGGGRGVYIRK
jgi:uncharacterized protein YjbJ (UPF0337 family)